MYLFDNHCSKNLADFYVCHYTLLNKYLPNQKRYTLQVKIKTAFKFYTYSF